MDACPLLITSIVAVKPEDQGTFFQDFLGLSGYLCSKCYELIEDELEYRLSKLVKMHGAHG